MVRRLAPAGYVAAKAATPYTTEPAAIEGVGTVAIGARGRIQADLPGASQEAIVVTMSAPTITAREMAVGIG